MGEVYLAQDSSLDRTVALKILPPEVAADPERTARFILEAKTASALDHANVAHIYEIAEANGIHFIAMQYVEGETLNTQIQDRPLPNNEIIDIAIQIADALDEAHAKGIVHRDIKPANIMINSRRHVKILDFGLARYREKDAQKASVKTEPGTVLGTIQYMSPEQALGKNVDARSDIFSLGVVLYQMATTKTPFPGETTTEILRALLDHPPEAVARFNYSIPGELERIILKCLEKDPDSRYQSARDLLVDLKNLRRDSQSGKITGRQPVTPRRSLWHRRSLITAAVILFAMSAIFVSIRARRAQTIHSLAVLPFLNASNDPNSEYLSDGITDSTINTLSQLPKLKVLARSTVFTYKGKEVDPRQLGRDLSVDAVITGSVFVQGDDLRVQINLVNAKDGSQMWGDQYNRKLQDIFSVQSEIANRISTELRLQLTGEQKQQMNKQYTKNVEAYRLYLTGRYHLNKRTKEDFEKADAAFQQAIVKDPNFAIAYAGLADCYQLQSNWGFVPAKERYPKAKAAAMKALQIDPALPEALVSLASIVSGYDWDWPGAERDFVRAIELNPNYATGHHWYSFLLSQVGRHPEALKEIQQAQLLDPLSLIINANAGYTLYVARKYDEAIAQLDKTLDLDPNFAIVYQYLGYVYEQKRMYPKAIESLETAIKLSSDNLTFKADLARVYAVSGKAKEAEEILKHLIDLSTQIYVPPFDIAVVYVGLGQPDSAMEWLEKAYEQRTDTLTYIKMDPRFDPLRTDPRFQDLLRRLHLA